MNRGSGAGVLAYNLVSGPSMRPRFMNRGSRMREEFRFAACLPSMRPRFMNRGSSGLRNRDQRRETAFNEAPIHESGKYRDQRRETATTTGLQ